MLTRSLFLLSLAPSLLLAEAISVNFERDNSDDSISSNDTAGYLPASQWNNINVGSSGQRAITIPTTALVNSLGVESSATLSINLSSAYIGSSNSGTSTPNDQFMASYLSWDPVDGTSPEDTGTVTVSNLPTSLTTGYSVYVYFDADVNTRSFDITVDGVTKSAKDASTFSGTFKSVAQSPTDANYAVFTGLTAESFTIAMNSDSGRAALNGFQIVSNDHPQAPEITSFTANDYYVAAGTNVNLSWACSEATSLSISPAVGDVTGLSSNGSGSTSISPNTTTTYTLTASNAAGTVSHTIRVGVGPARPNIVCFLVDDMGTQDTSVPFNLDSEGVPVKYNFNNFYVTPNMEILASQGMRFTTAYAQSVCSPTRTGLMNGRNSARHAVTDWVGAGSSGAPTNWRSKGLDSSDVTLPKLLQQGGYRTIHVGKAHFGSNSTGKDPLQLGFDINIGGANFGHPGSYTGNYGKGGSRAVPHLEAYHDTGTYLTKALTLEANKAIENASNEGRPFYLNMSFYAVHAPFTTNPDATGNYSGSTGSNHTKFATMIEGMDIAVGEIRQKLIDLGIAKDTLIVFLGDNGSDSPATTVNGLASGSFSDFPIRGKKGSKWEGGSRVPMIACWALPDKTNSFQQTTPIPANSIETDIVTSWDIPITLLEIAGLPKATDFGEDGHNLLPYFSGTPSSHRPQEVVIHYPHNHRSDYFSFIRQGDMKLIYNYQTNSHQLFDLASDPTESNDLATSQASTTMAMTRALAQRLDQLWGEHGVLLPTASSTAPTGNVVSLPNDDSIDSDADGLSDRSEDTNHNGLIDVGETSPDNSDSDGDKTNDGDEAKLGTDPLSSTSSFKLEQTILPNGQFQLSWPSAPGSLFTIRSSPDLKNWDTIVSNNIPAASGASSTSHLLPTPSGEKLFYRAELEGSP